MAGAGLNLGGAVVIVAGAVVDMSVSVVIQVEGSVANNINDAVTNVEFLNFQILKTKENQYCSKDLHKTNQIFHICV